ncbi:aminotransferase class IV, partial [Trinickia mobilis]|uniref:aminotransferase class IV n=1 Tax=Trinickia mobilis TaxID=2816356 RepID=UPI001A8EA1F7
MSIFDRGFTMGDGVYEVTSVMQGRMLEFDAHMARLMRFLNEVGMVLDTSATRLKEIHEELISLNKLDDGLVYLQV